MVKYFFIFIFSFFLFSNTLYAANGLQIKNEPPEDIVASPFPLNLQILNEASVKILKSSAYQDDIIEKYYSDYENLINHTQTEEFDIGQIFTTELTCEGIKANLNDVLPVFVEILQSALKNIPLYLINKATGIDLTPSGRIDTVIDATEAIYCAISTVGVVGIEQTIQGSFAYLGKAFDTFNVSADNKVHQGPDGDDAVSGATEKTAKTSSTDLTASTRTSSEIASNFALEYSAKFNVCMDSVKEFYNDVIQANIKDFTPYKQRKYKSFCSVVKQKAKKSPSLDYTVQSPIKYRAEKNKPKKKSRVCLATNALISCKTIDDEKIKDGQVMINEEGLNSLIYDKEKISKVSDMLPDTVNSSPLIQKGIKIISVLTDCINDNTSDYCEELSCSGSSAGTPHCLGGDNSIRYNAIPFTFKDAQDENGNVIDSNEVSSMLIKLKQKKMICLQTEVMNDNQKIKFIQELDYVINPSTSNRQLTFQEARTIFDFVFKKEFCGYEMEKQIEDLIKLNSSKYDLMEQDNLRKTFIAQKTLSNFKNLQTNFPSTDPILDNVTEMCTWKEGGDNPQTTTSILVRNQSNGSYMIETIQVNSLHNVSKTEPLFPVYGVCANENCSHMNCIYTCKDNLANCSFITNSPFSYSDLNNNNVFNAYNEYKTDPSNEYGSKEKRKSLSINTYLEKVEKARINNLDKVYNNYHNYENLFGTKIIIKQMKRQDLENLLFIY